MGSRSTNQKRLIAFVNKVLMVLLVGDRGASLFLLLILCSILVTLPNIGMVEASGTIYIRADGNVEGTDKIQRDGNVYTFTDNIYEPLVVEKDNIVVDGAGYSIEGPHTGLAQSIEGIGILVERDSAFKPLGYIAFSLLLSLRRGFLLYR